MVFKRGGSFPLDCVPVVGLRASAYSSIRPTRRDKWVNGLYRVRHSHPLPPEPRFLRPVTCDLNSPFVTEFPGRSRIFNRVHRVLP